MIGERSWISSGYGKLPASKWMVGNRPELLRAVVGQLPRLAVVCLPLLLFLLLGGAAARAGHEIGEE